MQLLYYNTVGLVWTYGIYCCMRVSVVAGTRSGAKRKYSEYRSGRGSGTFWYFLFVRFSSAVHTLYHAIRYGRIHVGASQYMHKTCARYNSVLRAFHRCLTDVSNICCGHTMRLLADLSQRFNAHFNTWPTDVFNMC